MNEWERERERFSWVAAKLWQRLCGSLTLSCPKLPRNDDCYWFSQMPLRAVGFCVSSLMTW